MLGGVVGKLLRVNLTHMTITEETIPDELFYKFIGGTGLGIKYLYDEVPAGVDPLGPENKLIFCTGPLVGAKLICTTRCCCVTKSPLTGTITSRLSGGAFPAELKFAGFDAIIVEGKAEKPVYLLISGGKVEIKNAEHLWGTKVSECMEAIKAENGDKNLKIASIGPAGENLVKFASIINDNEMRAFGRAGVGAVQGSKNLKAIAIKAISRSDIKIADEVAYKTVLKKLADEYKANEGLQFMGPTGTIGDTDGFQNPLSIYPSKNFTTTGDDYSAYVGEQPNNDRRVGNRGCYACPVKCGQLKKTTDNSSYPGIIGEPEYETIFSFGGECGNKDMDALIMADHISDEYGMDTISAGMTVGFAMELFEKGLITKEEANGYELNFGNSDAMVKILVDIALRKGFGNILAEGAKGAAQIIGKDAEKYAMHVKGLELPAYDIRGLKGMALAMATSYTGGDHNKAYAPQEVFGTDVPYAVDRFAYDGKAELAIWNQNLNASVEDSAISCVFAALLQLWSLEMTADALSAVTGIQYTQQKLMEDGERIFELARAFNVREGFNRSDDSFPDRIMDETIIDGEGVGQKLNRIEFEAQLDKYYKLRGWTANGIPTIESMTRLGLQDEFEKMQR